LLHASHLVSVSQDLAAKVRALVERRPTVLPNAVDTDVFAPGGREEELMARLGLPDDELLIGFSGELRAKKGLNFLLAAVQHVRRRQPARLLVIGEVRGGDRGEFERSLVGLGLEGAVRVTGHLEAPAEVARHLRLCDLFVLPSLWEGMPNGLLEAMACGVPVLASDAGGIPEIVRDGVEGLLVPRTHLHQLGARIASYLALPQGVRQRMAVAARQRVEVEHSLGVEREALGRIVAEITGR
jgi:glycosyltransferase involved in cell wall biosynthesis